MNVWRSTVGDHQWTDKDAWDHRKFADRVADIIHNDYEDIRRVAVIRIKSLKEKQA